MKEATGEASMTGITIAIIAVVAAIAVPIVRNLINSMEFNSCCASLGGEVSGGSCIVKSSAVTDKTYTRAEALGFCNDTSGQTNNG